MGLVIFDDPKVGEKLVLKYSVSPKDARVNAIGTLVAAGAGDAPPLASWTDKELKKGTTPMAITKSCAAVVVVTFLDGKKPTVTVTAKLGIDSQDDRLSKAKDEADSSTFVIAL